MQAARRSESLRSVGGGLRTARENLGARRPQCLGVLEKKAEAAVKSPLGSKETGEVLSTQKSGEMLVLQRRVGQLRGIRTEKL